MSANHIYNININVGFAIKYWIWFEHCALIRFFLLLPNRADKMDDWSDTYYRANMSKIHEQLPMLSTKDDTVYRYIKKLCDLWIIEKFPKLDYYRVTKKWLEYEFVGKISDQSEINPIDVGNKSDSVSEINPIYNDTSNNTNKNIKRNIINKNNKEPAVKIYDYLKKLTGVIDGDLNDCVYLHYKLEDVNHFVGTTIEKLEQIIPIMIDKWLSKYYSISSPSKLCDNLGTIVSKIATGQIEQEQENKQHIYIK